MKMFQRDTWNPSWSQFSQMHHKIRVTQIKPAIPETRRVVNVVPRRQASRNANMKNTILITPKRESGADISDWYLRPHEESIGQAVYNRKRFVTDYTIIVGSKVGRL